MRLIPLLLILASGLMVGCVTSRKSHPVIGKSVGKPLRTCRPAVLAAGETWAGLDDIYLTGKTRMTRLAPSTAPGAHRQVGGETIPVGTALVIDDIRLFRGDGHTGLTAYGVLDRKGRKIPFFADLGYMGVLERALWEGEQVPAKRYFDIFYNKEEPQAGRTNSGQSSSSP